MNPNIETALINNIGWNPARESIHITKEIDSDTVHWVTVYYDYLSRNKIEETMLYISSIGGDIYCTFAIVDIIRMFNKIKTNVTVIGPAFSGATVITVAATGKRYMTENSFLMIHDIWNEDSKAMPLTHMRRESKHLQAIQDKLLEIISKHSRLTKEELTVNITENIYYSALECYTYGLIDEIKKGA